LSFEKTVEDTAFALLRMAVTELPKDIKAALREAYEEETSAAGKTQLKAIIDNFTLAKQTLKPMCQDTGTIIFYLKAGADLKNLDRIEPALVAATKRATSEVPLRPNAVDPLKRKNTGDNTGRNVPYLNWEITSGNSLEITALPKGGGSENVCKLGMLVPGEGVKGLKKFVIDSVVASGAKPCPPNVLGIGFGGGADIAMKLAKRALLRPVDQPNPNPELQKLEEELMEAANATGIGPMGLGGKTTVIGVNIDYAARHPASYPAAVAFNCWAARRSTARIHEDGRVEFLTHELR
jgi:fumarate hydratase subunit alpha